MKIAAEKLKLRKIFKAKRLELDETKVAEESQKIVNNFIKNLLPKLLEKKPQGIFSLYISSQNEVLTSLLAEHFKKNNIKFSYPKIIHKNQALEFYLFEENQKLVSSQFFPQILEPLSGKKVLPDFLILPLLAFDPHLSRLGMGGGFFDRTIQSLKNQKPEILTIALAYEFQRLDSALPNEITDQRLDFVVTEESIFLAS